MSIEDMDLLNDSVLATALGGQVLLQSVHGYHGTKFDTASSFNEGTGNPIREITIANVTANNSNSHRILFLF